MKRRESRSLDNAREIKRKFNDININRQWITSDMKNHDICDACGDVGQFLCCDLCPNAFHFTCVEPPMDAVDVEN
ncbi:unnamed protein product [Rhizopus stolonifer]